MATDDTCCSIVPYFKVHQGKMGEFKSICERFIEATKQEEKVLYYGFCFDGDDVHCREAYADGDGVLAHLDNVGSILNEALQISTITRFEMHGPEKELEKVKEALKDLNPKYMNLQYGFRRPY